MGGTQTKTAFTLVQVLHRLSTILSGISSFTHEACSVFTVNFCNNNFISIALLSYVQGALQSSKTVLKNIYKFTPTFCYIYNE